MQANTETQDTIKSELEHFTGTENYYKHWLGLKYTDGVKFLAERCGAYWLIDVVGSYLPRLRAADDFLVVKLEKAPTRQNPERFVFSVEQEVGEGRRVIVRQSIPFSDFPLDSIKMFFSDDVLFLMSEY